MAIDDLFNNTVTQPKVWIERISLFESINLPPFREIFFKPGLNIIWAEETDDAGKNGTYQFGHGVGKTSLCRLMRYCLGEKFYAPRRLKDQVVAAYPKGYVAAKVWINGETWAVAKPLGTHKKSYFAKGGDISTLFAIEQKHSKEEYHNVLHRGVFGSDDYLTLPAGGQRITWEHLLSWCARDQEAHLDDFSVWRSLRSESDSPVLNRPKKDPVEMVRICLGYVELDELKLQKACRCLEREKDALEKKVEQTGQQPRFFHSEYVARVKRQLTVTKNIPVFNIQRSSPPTDLVGLAEAKIEKDQLDIEREKEVLTELDQQRVVATSKVSRISERLEQLEAIVDFNKDQNSGIEKELKKKQQLKARLKNLPDRDCDLGNIPLNKCEYALKYRERLTLDTKQQIGECEEDYHDRLKLIDEHSKRVVSVKQEQREAQKEYFKINSRFHEQDSKVRELESTLKNLESDLSELKRYDEVVNGRADNDDFVTAKKELKQKQKSLKKKQDQLKLAKQQQVGKAGVLNSYLNALADTVYSGLQGRVVLDDIARPFQLLGPGGEAFHALEVILGDLSAALFATHQPIIHPGFIIHDSPREADMGDNLYRGYFRMLIKMGKAMQKKSCYPIQYIVATTTMPLDGEGEEEFIRHRLHATSEDGLLFKRHLHEVGEGLFSESSSKGESP
ncbi:hypothetical protein MNBD_GAMMA18-405 [hydrothermal vent metagenome]|uniref:Uncharacterized protein n=1 Tax=hydrothermal vent metagenome TaxID=652676 RepID=A0A3B1A4B9_9ZZZZ